MCRCRRRRLLLLLLLGPGLLLLLLLLGLGLLLLLLGLGQQLLLLLQPLMVGVPPGLRLTLLPLLVDHRDLHITHWSQGLQPRDHSTQGCRRRLAAVCWPLGVVVAVKQGKGTPPAAAAELVVLWSCCQEGSAYLNPR
jgi:hypothetical protein